VVWEKSNSADQLQNELKTVNKSPLTKAMHNILTAKTILTRRLLKSILASEFYVRPGGNHTLRCVTLRYTKLRYVALRYVASRCVTLRCVFFPWTSATQRNDFRLIKAESVKVKVHQVKYLAIIVSDSDINLHLISGIAGVGG